MIEGETIGMAKGEVSAKQDAICKFMEARFKAEPAGIRGKVQQLTDREALDRILTNLFAANSIEEARTIIWDAVGKMVQ